MKKILIILLLAISNAPMLAMEAKTQEKQSTNVRRVQPEDLCMICNEEARSLDLNNVFQTNCCKQLLCHDCYLQMIQHYMENCPFCRKKEFGIEKALYEAPLPFKFEYIPTDVLIEIIKELLKTDDRGIVNQHMIDSYKGINALSRTNKYLHEFINCPEVIKKIMNLYRDNPYYAAVLGLPGTISWLNNCKKTSARLLLTNLCLVIDCNSFPSDHAMNLAKACVNGFLKASNHLDFQMNNEASKNSFKRIIKSTNICPFTSTALEKILTHPTFTFDNTSIAYMLKKAISCGNKSIVSLLLQNPSLDINRGIKENIKSVLFFSRTIHQYSFELSDEVNTPLMHAILKNKNDIAHLLLSHPTIDVSKKVQGKSALDIAKEMGNQELEEILEIKLKEQSVDCTLL